MATAYATIYGLVRTILGDTSPIVKDYADDVIQGQINWTVIKLNEPAIQLGDESNFAADLCPRDQVRMSLKIALNLIYPNPDQFSYATPIGFRVSRKGGIAQLIGFIQKQLDDVEGGAFPMAVDTDIRAMLNGYLRYCNDITAALNAG